MSDRQESSNVPSIGKHLLYIADPMCSWCYGFAPVIASIAQNFGTRVPIHVVMGGLRPGETRPSRDKDKNYLRAAWANVHGLSDQPFNDAFFDRDGFVYDTEPSARAVVTIRHVYPQEALLFLERLASAFYADNRDITDTGVIADIAHEAGFNRDEFLAAFQSASAWEATQQDFARCRQAGIRGFPTLLAGASDGYQMITHGYCTLNDIQGDLTTWAEA